MGNQHKNTEKEKKRLLLEAFLHTQQLPNFSIDLVHLKIAKIMKIKSHENTPKKGTKILCYWHGSSSFLSLSHIFYHICTLKGTTMTLTVVICALALKDRGTNPLKLPLLKGTVKMYPICLIYIGLAKLECYIEK